MILLQASRMIAENSDGRRRLPWGINQEKGCIPAFRFLLPAFYLLLFVYRPTHSKIQTGMEIPLISFIGTIVPSWVDTR